MLKLVLCEFAKLKRKRFVPLVVLSALLFPIPLSAFMMIPYDYDTRAQNFDSYFTFVLGDGITLLLPCILGVIAAMLFFMERDNDTFKNLRTIPVTSTQMVFAKIAVLFLSGLLFSIATAFAAFACGCIVPEAEVTGAAYKLLLSAQVGFFVTAGSLPLVVIIVFFSKTYIFSVLLCVFYSVLSLCAEACFETLPWLLSRLMPVPLITLWTASDLIRRGMRENISRLEHLFPSTLEVTLIVGAMALVSVALIDYLYKKRGE